METEYNAKRKYWESFVGADLRRMFLTIFRECSSVLSMMKIGTGTTIAYNVQNYLNHHFAEELNVDDVAAALYLNKDYITHVFKEETGYTLMSYVISLRINRAKLLLAQTDKSVTDIALDCGYADFSHFSKQFKKHVGVSPSRFRKDNALREQNILA